MQEVIKIEGGKKYYLGVYYQYEDFTKNYLSINTIKMYNVKSKKPKGVIIWTCISRITT